MQWRHAHPHMCPNTRAGSLLVCGEPRNCILQAGRLPPAKAFCDISPIRASERPQPPYGRFRGLVRSASGITLDGLLAGRTIPSLSPPSPPMQVNWPELTGFCKNSCAPERETWLGRMDSNHRSPVNSRLLYRPWSQLQPYFLNMRHLRLKRRVMSTEKCNTKSGAFRLDAKAVNKELIA